ncbi:MAG: hypothetical protein DI535_17200 [Citrobacter freundii]|nr:MAG: hypothetical protein DI535_17200 [Citrobacter freundii]
MKKNLLLVLLLLAVGVSFGQTTYYWVGGTAVSSFTTNSNWNTSLDGSGTARTAADPLDILIIDGTNIGGTTPGTGPVTSNVTTTGFGQLKLINGAKLTLQRPAGGGGTATLTVNGGITGDDLVIESGAELRIVMPTADGTIIVALATAATGRINGMVSMAGGAHRMVSQVPGALVFGNGASVTTNTTNYPFGTTSTSPAAVALGVVFESGSHLYYTGGNSPMGNNSTFSAIDFKAGSNYHIRASNGTGSFVNNKSFGNLFIENNATVTADGPIFRIGKFVIEAGASFTTHSSGHTSLQGDLVVDGTLAFPSGSSNTLVMGGSGPQTISGSGTLNVPSLLIANNAAVTLNRNVNVTSAINVYGKLDLAGYQLTGAAGFTTRVEETAAAVTGTLTAGSFQITNAAGVAGAAGLTVTGAGIPANTSVISFSAGNALITLSNPVITSGTNIALSFSSDTATLATSSAAGFDDAAGSVVTTGTKIYKAGTNYIINAATSKPFGLSTAQEDGNVRVGYLSINAPVTANRGVDVFSHLDLNNKLTIPSGDTLRMRTGAIINASPANYIITNGDAANGQQALVQFDDVAAGTIIPVGSASYYLPAMLTPSALSSYTVAVIEGATNNGLINGTPLTDFEKQKMVNAAWQINRINGTGDAAITLKWDAALEGSAFTTLANEDIGIITNNGSSWSNPVNTGDNTANQASYTTNSFGVFSVGSVPQVDPFVFNELPSKIYGDIDFNGGATSLNTAKPIVYSSNNTAIASIVNGNIHITGTGTVTITASQETDGNFPAASVSRDLTITKAPLLIKADDKTSPEGEALPALTATYTGFVYGETAAVLLTPAQLTTSATPASAVGTYPIDVAGATAANYIISFESGVLTVQPKQAQVISFNAPAVKKYGNADFATGATSTNTTIPITYTSSNTNVATITGNTIHITGAGTTTITASQAGNSLFFPATPVMRTLTVDKAALTIAVRDTSKVEGQDNPAFTFVYTGFVLGETAANLTTQPAVNTVATTASSAGYYTVTPANAVSNNYTITYTSGRLTILPANGADRPHLNAYMPNPTTLTTRIFSNTPALTDVVLWDLNGKPVVKRNTFLPKGFVSVNLMVGGVPSGVYIVTVRGNGVDLKQMIRIVR